MKKIILSFIIFTFVLAACGTQEDVTSTAEPAVTQAATKTPQPEPTVEAASRLGVGEEALNGLEITVWHP